MRKFKVGDRVKCTHDWYAHMKKGEEAVVYGYHNIYTSCVVFGHLGHSYSYPEKDFELVWTPEVGEMVEYKSLIDAGWVAREFMGMFGGQYLLKADGHFQTGQHTLMFLVDQIRPIKKTHTITLEDGTKVELSEESYEELKKAVK